MPHRQGGLILAFSYLPIFSVKVMEKNRNLSGSIVLRLREYGADDKAYYESDA